MPDKRGQMKPITTSECMLNAQKAGTVIPAFNISYLPMMVPIVAALRDTESFGLIAVARPDWIKFEAEGPKAVYDEYQRLKDERYMRLHMDHVPVIDEDDLRIDYTALVREAVQLGYESVMVDASRLPFDENVQATTEVVKIAHASGIPVEGELGAVLGHEDGPLPSYEELYATGRGFTSPEDAGRFVRETGVDWLSVAIGNIHGAISGVAARNRKVQARLNIDHLKRIHEATGIPLVLHGGSGIERECLREAIQNGITKINVATAIRQPYLKVREQSLEAAQKAVYEATVQVLTEELHVQGLAHKVNPEV
jgi:ketose-bisphosphate aldolase